MKITRIVFLVLLSSSILISCGFEPKAPEFRTVENIEPDFKNGQANLKGDIIMYNPNPIGFDIVKSNIDVYINQKKIHTINDLKAINVKNKAEFTVPFEISFEADKYIKMFFSSALGMLSSKKATVRMEGTIDFKVKGIPLTRDINFSKEVKLSK